MATVYVIHAEGDTPFVKRRVLRGLPSNGYDCWLARHHLAGAEIEYMTVVRAITQCQAILIILSPLTLRTLASIEEIGIALDARRTLIVVQIAEVGGQDSARLPGSIGLLPERVWSLPKVDFTVEGEDEAERLLASLLPPAGGESEAGAPKGAERIEWNEEIFSAALADATGRHDHAHAEALVAMLVRHLGHRPYAYPAQQAFNDLGKLRQERAFELMRRYAEAVVESGTRQDRVLRMYGQALIETGRYFQALVVLRSIINEPDSSREEIFEARGLIGRTYKQLYMDGPITQGVGELLWQAIAAYETAYVEERGNFWHGVNAVSCILRAERDGIAADALPGRAQEIAQRIAEDIERLEQNGPLPVWDCASRVEALLALGRYDEAERALGVYINHPDMSAFEVSSTYRQFDQVLELGRDPRGAAILARLRDAVERYRAGKIASRPDRATRRGAESAVEDAGTKHLVIRLSDPGWDAKGIAGLVIQSRLGMIVTAHGPDECVRKLLDDPKVISVEESRAAGHVECDRSLPFIKAAAQFTNAAGTYEETGDRALIAVIDNGIDVLHKAFLDAHGKSRIVGIWDQTDTSGTAPDGFSYGTFHDEAAVARYVESGAVPKGLGRNDGGHGTHVASIAGGRAAGDFAGGVAPDARLLIVVSASGGPIGYSLSHIEALAFVDGFASKLGLPVVVNVSQGMNAGAHDGTSALEAAFDAFAKSGSKPGRVVVKSAGNEGTKGGHAKVTMLPKSLEQLIWTRAAGAYHTERIELWWSSADEMEFRLRGPSPPGDWSDWVVTASPECKGTFPEGGPFRLVFTKRHVDNGDSMLLIELGDETGAAATGDWALEIRGGAVREDGEIHAWIERTQGTPSSFRLPHVSADMTLSIPGTAQSVITVGAVDACEPIQVGPFSSFGPTRDKRKKPLVCAPGVRVRAAEGGTFDGAIPEDGTSMAAPHVSGAIALLLSRTAKAGANKIPSGNQIAAVLRQKAQNYNGRWSPAQGYGVIDVAALLAAFD